MGRMEGKLDMLIEGQRDQSKKIEALDARVRANESKTAVTSFITSGIMSVATSILAVVLMRK
jgi:hypothetical protein